MAITVGGERFAQDGVNRLPRLLGVLQQPRPIRLRRAEGGSGDHRMHLVLAESPDDVRDADWRFPHGAWAIRVAGGAHGMFSFRLAREAVVAWSSSGSDGDTTKSRPSTAPSSLRNSASRSFTTSMAILGPPAIAADDAAAWLDPRHLPPLLVIAAHIQGSPAGLPALPGDLGRALVARDHARPVAPVAVDAAEDPVCHVSPRFCRFCGVAVHGSHRTHGWLPPSRGW